MHTSRRVGFSLAVILMSLTPAAHSQESSDALLGRAKTVLPQLDGELRVPGLKEPVEVLRDRWGVPHIYAKNQDDLFFAQGFVAAQDRLFQIDLWRRVGLGQTAEIFGEVAVSADYFARLLRYRGDMNAEWRSYAPDAEVIATAFTQGINAYIDRIGDKLPIEFQVLGYKPAKWQPADILGRMSGIIMTNNFQREVARAGLISKVGLEQARVIAPTDPPRPFAPAPGLDLAGITSDIFRDYTVATRALKFRPSTTESNNWVVDGSLSASGKPLLASDPHRALAVPSLRYLVHLNAPGWNVIGSGEPALPGIALGHNERIAWGFTIVGTDQADIYVEQTHPDDPLQYKVGDRWESMRVVRESIRVKGHDERRELRLCFTRHGPVIHHDEKKRLAFALKWVGSEPGGAAYLGALSIARAQNRKEFVDSLNAWKTPGENFAYADVDGQIGWVAAGLTPIRKGWDGLLPVPGESDQYEWQGYLPLAELPQSFNPPKHWLATANHNILPPGYKHEIAYEWAAPHRFLRIQDRLSAASKFTLDDFQSIQHENTSLPGQALVRVLKATDLPAELAPFAKLFTQWDGVLTRDAKAGPLYAVWLQELTAALYGDRLPKDARLERGDLRSVAVLLEQLTAPSEAWFGKDPALGRDALVRKTFETAVARTRKLLGDDPNAWSWGKMHTATFEHPLASMGTMYAETFNLGPVERPGDSHTPNNTRHDDNFKQIHGASYRQLFDLADWDRGLATSTPGQSGQPGSPHYGDLLPLWADGKYFPLAYSRQKVEEVKSHRLLLQPAPAGTRKATHTYKQVGSLAVKADVYGYDDSQQRPVVVWVHGGALIMGHRESVPRWLSDACREYGFVLVSIDYRLAPETQLPEIIADLEDAFRWVRDRGPQLFHADPQRIGVVGGSAGGYLTLTAGFRAQPRPTALVSLWGYGDLVGDWYSRPSPHLRHQTSKMSREEAFQQVSGPPISDARERKGNGGAFYQFCRQQGLWPKAVSGWDPHQEAGKFAPYMPVKNVSREYPPTLLIHGDKDTDVPYEQSVLMAEQFKKSGVEHRLITLAGAEHGLAGGDPQAIDEAYRAAVEFLQEHLSRK